MSSPGRTPAALEAEIVELRTSLLEQGPDAEAHTIASHLHRRHGDAPSVATIWRILRRQMARVVVEVDRMERSIESMRAAGVAKLERGERVPDEYFERLRVLRRLVLTRKLRLGLKARDDIRAVLGIGPRPTAWARARLFAAWSLIFSLPWIGFYIQRVVGNSRQEDFATLWLLGSGLFVIATWTLYGLFFGYFYPSIRGESGLEKGFLYGGVLLLPWLLMAFLQIPTGAGTWASFTVFALPVFVTVMLLGLLAGDLETFRAAGLGWKHLVDIHHMRALTAWGTSVVVAVGAAVTTILTSQATTLFTAGLQALGIIKHNVPVPMPSPSG